jgi:hypothetical protein
MGAAESSEPEPDCTGMAAAMIQLKKRKANGELSEEQFDAEMKALLSGGGSAGPEGESDAGKQGAVSMLPAESSAPAPASNAPAAPAQGPKNLAPSLNGHSTSPNLSVAPPALTVGMEAEKAELLQSRTAVEEGKEELCVQKFEEVSLGEGGLGIKIVRLKAMRDAGKISVPHFDWCLKRLLRVRAFGCPGDHDLDTGATTLQGWTCNVCYKQLPIGTRVFSCRTCDWDGCCDCLAEAKRTAKSEVKYDWWWGEEDEEGEVRGESGNGVGGGERDGGKQPEGGGVRVRCSKGCALEQGRVLDANYRCDVCGQVLPARALVLSCRECNFDACGLCYSRLSPHDLSSVQVNKPEQDLELEQRRAGVLRCVGGHALLEYCTPDEEWACDMCKQEQEGGAFMFGCRICNWDSCLACAATSAGPSLLPPTIRPSPQSMSKGALTRDILRLKRSHAAGWLNEEEYNFELKKLLSAKSFEASQPPPNAPKAGPADEAGICGDGATNGRREVFGCPHLHPMKMFQAPDHKWSCNWCGNGVGEGSLMIGCRACDWDACEACHDRAQEAGGSLTVGSMCWYQEADGSYAQAVIESIDGALTPPSYLIRLQHSSRETEGHRLRHFLPLKTLWHMHNGAPPPPPPSSAAPQTALHQQEPPASARTTELVPRQDPPQQEQQQEEQQQAERRMALRMALKEEHAKIEAQLLQQQHYHHQQESKVPAPTGKPTATGGTEGEGAGGDVKHTNTPILSASSNSAALAQALAAFNSSAPPQTHPQDTQAPDPAPTPTPSSKNTSGGSE